MTQNKEIIAKLPQDIGPFVPHKRSMLLVDSLLSVEKDKAITLTKICKNNIFLSGLKVPSLIGVELIAQTIAGYAGYHDVLRGKEVKEGLLVAIRRFKSSVSSFTIGECLITEVKLVYQDEVQAQGSNGLSVFSGDIYHISEDYISTCFDKIPFDFDNLYDSAKVVSATLSVYQPDNLQSVINIHE